MLQITSISKASMLAEDQEVACKVTLSAVSLASSRVYQGQQKFPTARANFVAVMYHKAKVLIIGGDMGDREFNDIWELNLRTKLWRKIKRELREPLVGHKCVKLRVLSKESLVKGSGRGLLLYGGWQRTQYSDTLYLLDMYTLDLKECPRNLRNKLDDTRGPRSTFDTKKQIEADLTIPEARRDHSMCFHDKLNVVVMIGGWNALEWHPDQVALEIWVYSSGTSGLFQTGAGNRSHGTTSQWCRSTEEATRQIMIQKLTLLSYTVECLAIRSS